ncbi:MAG TPA: shikimate dehydrogenase [Pyrinomonadaceae bacterium]|nr:shikimate dehydrogenase [Pyrinomonadaceae bacterium]
MESKATICVPICEQSISALAEALVSAALSADLLELRLDCLNHTSVSDVALALNPLLSNFSKPVILTLRPANQGGYQELSSESRLQFWQSNRPLTDALLDIEFDLIRTPKMSDAVSDWSRVICSHHDFVGLPSDLDGLYDQLAHTPARILKIAVQAADAIDCLPIFHLLDRAQKEERELIAIAMGQAGLMTRILGPSRGSFLTYAARDNETTTAPGQIGVRELRDVYRIAKIDRQTEIFGLVGSPVSHSLSPRIHNAAFETSERNAVYIPFEVRDLPAFVRRMVHPRTREIEWNLRGLSVTAPHKLAVMQHLDWVEPAAREIGAVNTVAIDENGLRGYNTDAIGFIRPLLERLGSLNGARCAVIGTGGAASAAVLTLKTQGAEVTVFGRTPERAVLFAKRFEVVSEPLNEARFQGFDVVVNATPLGTSGRLQSETPVCADQLHGARLVYDLVYNPLETEFLRQARTVDCQTLGGAEMFLAQAHEQFRLWTGGEAPSGVMRKALEAALSER